MLQERLHSDWRERGEEVLILLAKAYARGLRKLGSRIVITRTVAGLLSHFL